MKLKIDTARDQQNVTNDRGQLGGRNADRAREIAAFMRVPVTTKVNDRKYAPRSSADNGPGGSNR